MPFRQQVLALFAARRYKDSMQALTEYMRIAGMSQSTLAKRLGINQGQLNHWLKKRRSPSAENLKLISEKTGISLEKLVQDL